MLRVAKSTGSAAEGGGVGADGTTEGEMTKGDCCGRIAMEDDIARWA